MADRGSIGTQRTFTDPVANVVVYAGVLAIWAGSRIGGGTPYPSIGVLSGVVSEDEVPVVGRKVYLYDRASGELIRSTVTDANGNYAFTGLNTLTMFRLVAVDPDFNGLVLDGMLPV
jgi:hypothetical protein